MNQNLISIFIILFSLYLPNKLTEAKPIKEQKDIVLENVRKSFFNDIEAKDGMLLKVGKRNELHHFICNQSSIQCFC